MERIQISKKGAGVVVAAAAMGVLGVIWMLRPPTPGASTRRARKIVAALREFPASPLRVDPSEVADLLAQRATDAPAPKAHHWAKVTLPDRSTEPLRVEDGTTGMVIGITPRDVNNVVAQSGDGYFVYPHAHTSGGALLHRALADGAEDFVSFETRPAVPEVVYDLSLGQGVSGLRLVEGTLEMLDEDGAPQLRAAPPFIAGADGVKTDATMVVEGCAVDTDPAAPWGRDVTPPGADSCTLRVRWPDEQVVYPAVLDPRWTTTGSMTTPRQGHTATLLSTGNVLVVGGTSNGTTALASAELYNKSTGTWAATASMTGARTLHTATQLNTGSNSTTSGMVLVAGGLNGSTSQNTAQLYSPTAGTWAAAANLNAARHGQAAVLLASGNVLLAGGLNGTTVLNTAAIYNPSSGTGTWTATGNMPQAVKFHSATRLNVSSNGTLNNKVLVVGGNSGTASVANVQLFDGTSTWSSLTALSSTREGHTATALANGNVLVAGGKSGSTILNTTQLFNAASGSGSWSSAGTLTTARQLHAAVLLPSSLVENGQVLLAGGNNGTSTLGTAELWNGTTTWTATTALPTAVQAETLTLLQNNMVLIAGGVNGSTTVATADLYDASFSLACTSNSQCATGFCVSGVCCDTACNGGCGVCNLTGHVGTCSAASNGTVCRAASGTCDVAETCNGTSLTCPTDAVAALGTVCRSANGACDVPETCNGTTKACPADGFAPATTVCRASTGTCDAAETCTGTSAACPADAFASAGTVCRPAAGGCDVAETCTGTSSICPPDTLAASGSVCRPAESICDLPETCNGTSSACPTDAFAAAGTACGAATSSSPAPICSGAAGSCPVASGTSDVLGFESAADWSLDVSDSGTTAIVGLNPNRTQGESSLEVIAQNFARFNSAPVSSIGTVGPLVLIDVLLPTSQANQFWYGDAQMFVNSPTLGIFNVPFNDIPLTGLALGSWQTLAFQMPAATASTIANGVYADLTFSFVLNVPSNETGHYLIDNIRSTPDVVPSLLGIAQDGSTLKAIFDYQTTSSTPVNIPYGTANGLTNQNGFVASPPEVPPTTFVSTTHAPFVATLSGSLLTWTVGSHSVTATPSSPQLTVTNNGDGTDDATLPNGTKVNLDSTPPPNPTNAGGPPVGAPFNGVVPGQLSVSPLGAATYTVPISISPGVAGMAPNLALVYSSQGGDGIAGEGWNLSGLSTISRCPRTRQQDGFGRPVMLDSLDPSQNADKETDGICLDGAKLFQQAPGTGSCPSSSPTPCYVGEKQDFSQMTLNSTGEFQVVTKAGETRYYGLNASERVIGGPSDQVGMWLLDRVVDAWGNYFDVHYNLDSGSNIVSPNAFITSGVWVSEIDYTGSLAAPQSSPFNKVTFGYLAQNRGDVHWTALGALKIPQVKLLQTITTPSGQYSLSYQGGTNGRFESLLQQIGYCAGTLCMQPLIFGWQNQGGGVWPSSSGYQLPQTVVAKGKGLKGVQFADINGDGLVDVIVGRAKGVGGSPELATLLNTGTGWSAPITGSNQTFPLYLSDNNDNPTDVVFADMDGDGAVDVLVDDANVACLITQRGETQTSSCQSCPPGVAPGQPGCQDATNYSPAVWLNRFKQGGGWEFHPEYANMPPDVNNANSISEPNPSLRGVGFGIVFPPGNGFSPDEAITVADVNGDGMADLVRVFDIGLGQTRVDSLLAQPPCVSSSPGNETDQSCEAAPWIPNHQIYTTTNAPGKAFVLQDINRDGLPDLVSSSYAAAADGAAFAVQAVMINTSATGGALTFGPPSSHGFDGTASFTVGTLNTPAQFGDIDGDGFYDLVAYYNAAGLYGNTSPAAIIGAVGFGNGSGFGFESEFTTSPFAQTLKTFSPPEGTDNGGEFTDTGLVPLDNAFALLDVNGDGLADFIQNHQGRTAGSAPNLGGGQIFLSNGTNWVLQDSNQTSWQISAGSTRIPGVIPSPTTEDFGSAFVDLNGDGFPDLIQADDNATNLAKISDGLQVIEPNAWLNSFQQPVITGFPNGLAKASTVTYVYTTTALGAATYKDDDTTDVNTKPLALPMNVVANVLAEDGSGTGSTDTTTYTYHSLRQDSFGRGPLGFDRVEIFDQASQLRTVTIYNQAYPYTGMPKEVDKYQVVGSQSHLTNKTTTLYCDTTAFPSPTGLGCGAVAAGPIPSGTTTFTYPRTVDDIAYLHPETDDLTNRVETTSQFQYDQFGNSTFTDIGIERTENGVLADVFEKDSQNTYTTSEEQLEGKPDSTVVFGIGGTKNTTHTTTFEYSPVSTFGGVSSRLALTKKHVEPGAGWPLQLDSAYAYDRFGNLATTTECASDFGTCTAGATNPSTQADPQHHPPFRTTSVSYDPSILGIPVSYGPGRYPTRTVNTLGHTETTLYDPVLGEVLDKTGPNDIRTCYVYDALGRLTSETGRCGSPTPLTTTTQSVLVPPQFCVFPPCSFETGVSLPHAATMTVVTPPTGATTWNYSDDQGKAVGSLSYAFDGGFIETTTTYNALGQVTQAAKPVHLAAVTDQVSPSLTTTVYDSFNRVSTVTDPLGVIDSTGAAKSTTIVTTYNGSTIETDRQVNGQTQTRKETKNGMGKIAAVTTQTETGPSTISYGYDADGNLTLTTDPAGNQVQIGYDTRGRKISTTDPDMGTWQYCVDGFGDLTGQIDAKSTGISCSMGTPTIAMTYDPLDRMLTKTDSTGTAHWAYDTAHGAGIGKLAVMVSAPDPKLNGTCAVPQGVPAAGGQVAVKFYVYTEFGDVQEVDECTDGTTFAMTFQYDALGRQSLVRYPMVNTSQLAVGYHYTNLGYLQYLTDESSDHSVLWQAKAMNVLGQVIDEQMKNGVETVSNRNSLTGWLLGSTAIAHADNNNVIQNPSYGFDEIGNLLSRGRSDVASGNASQESFGYDLTNRLTAANTIAYAYDPLGNLTNKAGTAYTYGAGCQAGNRVAGPHAVCTVGGGTQYSYDDNGNLTSNGSRTVAYNSSNKITDIESVGGSGASVGFMYGADGNRVVETVTSGGSTTRTVYVGLGATGKSLYERTTTGANTKTHVHYIYAGNVHNGNAFALRVLDDSGAPLDSKYYSFDHLGSITAMSDQNGRVATVQTAGTAATVFSYDPWGARRNPDGTTADPASFPLPTGNREFTGQEQIPDVGLVNMNGRVYDPSLGRFLSPDPNVQFVADLQSYNRYSYAGNNPLRYTDPTGYFWSGLGGFFEKYFSNPMTDAELALSLTACALGGAGCVVLGLELAAFNAGVALANGAGVEQTLLNTAIGLGVGLATGGLVSSFGGNALVGLLVGSASAAVTTGISNVVSGGSFFGYNTLGAALISAAQGAATLGLQQVAKLSQADSESDQPPAKRGPVHISPSGSDDPLSPGAAQVQADIDEAHMFRELHLYADANQCFQQAINDAVSAYGIDTSAANGVYFDPTETDEGVTDFNRTVRIGPSAFQDAGYLGSTIGHEAEVHAFQNLDDNLAVNGTSGRDLNEAQAYQYELDNSGRFGLNQSEIAWIQGRYDLYSQAAINGGYGAQIAYGTYTVRSTQLHQF